MLKLVMSREFSSFKYYQGGYCYQFVVQREL